MRDVKPSVIIPNLNSPTVGRTIASVRAQLPEVEIVVVGRDEPGALEGLDVHFMATERVLNPAEARNAGCAQAGGDVFLFIDADCEAEPGWAQTHLEAQRASPGIVGGAVTFDRTGYWATADNISSFHFLLPDATDDRGLASLNLSVSREAFESLVGFDEELPPCEDLDFSLRAGKAGVDVRFEPRALVRHAPARTRLTDLLRHARWYGGIFPVFVQRYPEALGMGLTWRHPWLLLVASPLKSVAAAIGIFARHPTLLRSLHLLPGVALFRQAYYLAAVKTMTRLRQSS